MPESEQSISPQDIPEETSEAAEIRSREKDIDRRGGGEREKRETLRHFLPPDLQLRFVQKRPGEERWDFQGELLQRRHSPEATDQIFYQALRRFREETKEKAEKVNLDDLEEKLREEKEKTVHYFKRVLEISQVLEDCAQKGWWGAYASLFKSASEVGIDLSAEKERISQGLEDCAQKGRWDAYASLFKSASEAGIESFAKTRNLELLTQALSDLSTDNLFTFSACGLLLQEDRDPQELREILPAYQALKETAIKVNSQLPEAKQWQNPEEFFQKIKVSKSIALLLTIDSSLGSSLLRSQISRGLSFAEANLNLYQDIAENPQLIKSLTEFLPQAKKEKGFDAHRLSQFLETASAYQRMNLAADFERLCQQEKSFFKIQNELNVFLLQSIAKDLGVDPQSVQEADLTKWHLQYLPNLATHLEIIKQKGNLGEVEDIFKEMMRAVFENRFEEFITAKEQAGEYGQRIARHNRQVRQAFEKAGVDWQNWQNPKIALEFAVETESKINREALFDQFEERLKALTDSMQEFYPPLANALFKDLEHLKQQKKEFNPEQIDLDNEEQLEGFLPRYLKTLNYLRQKAQKEKREFSFPPAVSETFGHLRETIQSLQQKLEQRPEEFQVRLWDRDPRRDLFQGNFTHCCISVGVKEAPGEVGAWGTLNPKTIIEYLIDQGIQVTEIVDETGKPVAQTWLFVSLDQEGRPVLVADNFEVNMRYPSGGNANRSLREAMFQFLKRYAQSCHIEKVVLGQVAFNDVETSDLPTINLPPIKKLGGYLWGDNEPYYLEARNQTTLHWIK